MFFDHLVWSGHPGSTSTRPPGVLPRTGLEGAPRTGLLRLRPGSRPREYLGWVSWDLV
ncbi:histidine--tRNA ligase [Sesbania bispinosa]|nr:histidine--tRNA ligase [Sesbania bispinosa]